MDIYEILFVIAAYLVGSISSAIIVCKLMGLPDPRSQGSGNPGATNVLRMGSKKGAAITLAGDMLKGLLPVLLASYLEMSILTLALTGFAAFIGHLYPVFFQFQGGKGVATMLGVLTGLSWQTGAAAGLTWLVVAKVFKISSLSALIAMLLAPLYLWLFLPAPELIYATSAMTAILFIRHRKNILNLLSGKEGKIGKKS